MSAKNWTLSDTPRSWYDMTRLNSRSARSRGDIVERSGPRTIGPPEPSGDATADSAGGPEAARCAATSMIIVISATAPTIHGSRALHDARAPAPERASEAPTGEPHPWQNFDPGTSELLQDQQTAPSSG